MLHVDYRNAYSDDAYVSCEASLHVCKAVDYTATMNLVGGAIK